MLKVSQDHSGLENWKFKTAILTPICYRIFAAELLKTDLLQEKEHL